MQSSKTRHPKVSNLQTYKKDSLRKTAASQAETLKRTLMYLWDGPSMLPSALRLEWRFVAIRWMGIIFLAPTLVNLNLSGQQLSGAYVVLAVAIMYNISLQYLLVRRAKYFINGYLITIFDGFLDVAMIVVAGGFGSPFAAILYTVVVATAMRFGYGPVLAMAVLFIAADGAESLILGEPLGPAFVFRSSFLLLTGVLAGYLHEQTKEAETALEERLLEANNLNKELEAFSYSVSHDLRAPLRSIDGFSQALLEDYHDQLDEEGQDYLDRVRAASQRMAELIDDLLNLSRLTRSDMSRANVNLSHLARTINEKLQQMDPDRQVDLIITRNAWAVCDPQLLQVVLENLFSNAWKFTEKTLRPRIVFGVTEHDGKEAYFVRDNGVGFDMAYADKLFGAFQRLHTLSEFDGNGIGLATVQRIVHRHGGQVWGESTLGQGATFYFTL